MEFENDIVQCLRTLRDGGTILYPTDTVWGIGCDASNEAAVNKIFAIKQRPEAKSLIVLMADPRDINRYVSRPDPQVFAYLQSTVRPTTIIYEAAVGLAENLTAADGSVAIRITKDDFCKHLIKRLRMPLVSSSANISGHETPLCFKDIPVEIKQSVDYVVQYRQSDDQPAQASTIIRFSSRGEIQVIRP